MKPNFLGGYRISEKSKSCQFVERHMGKQITETNNYMADTKTTFILCVLAGKPVLTSEW